MKNDAKIKLDEDKGIVILIYDYKNKNQNNLADKYFIIRHNSEGSTATLINSKTFDLSMCYKDPILFEDKENINDIKYNRFEANPRSLDLNTILYGRKFGIDLFDPYSDFLNDICFKFTSEKGTDVAMKKISDTFEVQPMNAHVEQFNPEETEKFIYVNGHNGFLFDKDSIKKQLDMILNSEDKMGIIYLTLNEVPFKTDLQTVKANTKLIASHYTTAANVWASNYNMELAIKSANGTIVKPGEIFSFNGMTGDTTTGDLWFRAYACVIKICVKVAFFHI